MGVGVFADTLFLFEVGKAAFLLPKFERLLNWVVL